MLKIRGISRKHNTVELMEAIDLSRAVAGRNHDDIDRIAVDGAAMSRVLYIGVSEAHR